MPILRDRHFHIGSRKTFMMLTRWQAPLRAAAASLSLLCAPATLAAVGAQQIAAAQATAAGTSCSAAGNFYWEVGDKTGASASGVRGRLAKDGNTAVPIASGSKLLFAAYVVQYRHGAANLSPAEIAYLTMRQGYTRNDCAAGKTVLGCFEQFRNDVQSTKDIGKFYYGGGHMQALASLGLDRTLAGDSGAILADSISAALGIPPNALSYSTPTVASGAVMSPMAYAAVLRQILAGDLLMSQALGVDAVCTSTATDASGKPLCPSAVYTPPGPDHQVWQYSLGHWVEKDPDSGAGDGAFSSPGEHGFYPWIDASRSYYGVVSRSSAFSPVAYQSAILCGQAIRKAFVSGTPQ
jgi:hypothetical protein